MSRYRYEKEIEKILEKAGEGAPPPVQGADDEPPRRLRSPVSGQRKPARTIRLKYQYMLLIGFGLIVAGAFFNWVYFFLAGLALLVTGYVIYYRAPRGGQSLSQNQRMWRGRSIDPDDPPGR